jgi:octaprenyl-diphosphate synthase
VTSVKDIKAPVAFEMKEFEAHFKKAMKSTTPLLDKITHYIIKRKGKQMRPMFVFLSAKCLGQVSESTYTAASLIELLHTATLVHDDVVDDANTRRGFFSINALWKNKIAVLVGDYLLSQGLLLSIENGEFELLKYVSRAVKEMSEGELLQIEKARKLNIQEEDYYNIIRQKTASLIAACCATGASSVQASKEDVDKMYRFGELVGMAFQIKDDLFDYGSDNGIGKPTGIDIKERKLTLPLIHALNSASNGERKMIINTVKNHNDNPEKVRSVVEFVKQTEGIKYANEKMRAYADEAIAILMTMPQNEARDSLAGLVEYTINRVK